MGTTRTLGWHWLGTDHARPSERRQGDAADEFPAIDH